MKKYLNNIPRKEKIFIEIGSCDFDTLNHFANEGWSGFIIDPMKKYLNNIPRKEGVKYLPIAIDHVKGERIIHYAEDNIVDQDKDFAGMSTFIPLNERDWGCRNVKGGKMDFLSGKMLIQTDTFRNVIRDYSIERIDFLKIDTEGYDFEILKSFPWDNVLLRPKIIKVEHYHVVNGISEITKYLEDRSYHVYTEVHDLYAIKLN